MCNGEKREKFSSNLNFFQKNFFFQKKTFILAFEKTVK